MSGKKFWHVLRHVLHRVSRSLIASFFSLTLVPAICGAVTSEPHPQKYALLIGINDYHLSDFPSLKGAINDVRLLRDLLVQRFRFKADDIEILTDADATHTGIMTAFQRLTDKVHSGDIVYIHYSGHGSEMHDENGDEADRRGLDSTWVSYGARASESVVTVVPVRKSKRSKSAKGKGVTAQNPQVKILDDFDVLDDEIGVWLTNLGQKSDQVVFVSDSCHSGTITRGADAVQTRGVPMDGRLKHPMGNLPLPTAKISALSFSASRDEETASEYIAGQDYHGMFTWHWAQALAAAGENDTWGDVFKRVSTLVEQSGHPQHPQAEGNLGRRLFAGDYPAKSKTVAVKSARGTTVTIDAGSLVGVTVGSTYAKYGATPGQKDRPLLEIVRTAPTWSEAKATAGGFSGGDLVVLETYSAPSAPVKVFIRADLESDRLIAERIKAAVAKLPAFTVVDAQAPCDLILQILRPKKEGGSYLYPRISATLPASFPEERLECWVLTSDERLYQNQEKLKVPVADDAGIKLLLEDIDKLTRVKNLLSLSAAPGQEAAVELSVGILSRVATADLRGKAADYTDEDGTSWRKGETVPVGELDKAAIKVGQMLEFSVRNRSDQPYYVYLINFLPDGTIQPFYPLRDQSSEYGVVRPGASRLIDEVRLKLDKAGNEYLRMIVSLSPIDIYLLEQATYRGKGTKEGAPNPLETLLAAKAGRTRGGGQSIMSPSEWATVLGSYSVSP